ncbi:SHREC complex ATP-dependent chromatin remodeller Mit1 [Schizosaccharomyces pombe]|uniref:ATP-dependent chromatin remodeler mit1 n=2 Tax=Schizosaccharomyces pombe (strain 972 / ATCC 24843) TaxID=284812 RepID=CHD1C_SCHPO|nr:SHREC complex subunit Mit1 [Schizosaccharomyces pombe]Q9P793.1 RecName: Full=Chromatin remodeling factor mit1; AltName: Full=Mi2-like interacting with clr3 protein 1; AltName: Full=Snf2/Hdac-containing repressor complex protein mit1; Short=SHREC protein mit1 [Schizosaccharomyces pombe 972h-]CAB87372.1 SHREC complex subunit Mit1 [Schizosaccharomyces pombe]|eukprot:NP_595385.1 SHREC complex subunit Mit1 [Schizosaccharomyces pombe]
MPKEDDSLCKIVVRREPLDVLLPYYDASETTVQKILHENDSTLSVKFLAGVEALIKKDELDKYKNGKACLRVWLKHKSRKRYHGYMTSTDKDEEEKNDYLLKSNGSKVLRDSTRTKKFKFGKEFHCALNPSFVSDETASDSATSSSSDTNKKVNRKEHNELSLSHLSFNDTSDFGSSDLSSSEIESTENDNKAPYFSLLYSDGFDFIKFLHVCVCVKCHGREHRSSGKNFVYCDHCSNVYHYDCSPLPSLNKETRNYSQQNGFICPLCSKNSKDVLCNTGFVSGVSSGQDLVIPPSLADRESLSILVNYCKSIRFRCFRCRRVEYFFYLDSNPLSIQRTITHFIKKLVCNECSMHPCDIEEIIAWRTLNSLYPSKATLSNNFVSTSDLSFWSREYFVRSKGKSYLHCFWCSASWLAGISLAKKKNFDGLENASYDATKPIIPVSYTIIDKVWDVQYRSGKNARTAKYKTKKHQLKAISEVTFAFVSWRGLTYYMSNWEPPPKETDRNRWKAWLKGYSDLLECLWIEKAPTASINIDLPFTNLEWHSQPSFIKGGTLMPYQLKGLNWLYLRWYTHHPCILADEMGLGKTVQVISFISVLFYRHKCFPVLVIVPHATVANWERELKKWAPFLQINVLVGSEKNRSLVRDYRLINQKDPKHVSTHVLVISASNVEREISLLRKFQWKVLIVDEGQRLKNDQSSLFYYLSSVKSDFKLLLTGTPLQNNVRELFNLLQFLNPMKINAAELEKRYSIIDTEKVTELHQILKPFFLRRVKSEVLDNFPTKVEVIIPLSMTPVQKGLYKSILSKNLSLLRNITGYANTSSSGGQRTTSLNNILMQLRKTLAHPYIYSPDIEDRNLPYELAMRSLEEASCKFLILRLLVPKLITRGHRILLFSQFIQQLDILEDWFEYKNIAYARFDGASSEMERQSAIDSFNAPNSELSCFLLSTRAGGVGINLASADTVIILDPDFNPHQDMQAIARAHRYGQKKKVLVFVLTTRDSVEEKIIQNAQKKLVLDHLIVESLDQNHNSEKDLESILRHGARALFEEAGDEPSIKYNEYSVELLISEAEKQEDTSTDESDIKSNKFGFFRVWDNKHISSNHYEVKENVLVDEEDVWSVILKQREKDAMLEKTDETTSNRRLRAHHKIHYGEDLNIYDNSDDTDYTVNDRSSPGSPFPIETETISSITDTLSDKQKLKYDSSVNIENLNDESDSQKSADVHFDSILAKSLLATTPKEDEFNKTLSTINLEVANKLTSSEYINDSEMQLIDDPVFYPPYEIIEKNHQLVGRSLSKAVLDNFFLLSSLSDNVRCRCCGIKHLPAHCPLSIVPLEICFLCGTPHFSGRDTCPMLRNKEAIYRLKDSLSKSREPFHIKKQAMARLNSFLQKKEEPTVSSSAKTNELSSKVIIKESIINEAKTL